MPLSQLLQLALSHQHYLNMLLLRMCRQLSRAMHTLADGEQQDVNYISKPRNIDGASVQLPHPSANYHHISPSLPHVPINRPYMLM